MDIEIISQSSFCIVKVLGSLSITNVIGIQKDLENIFITNSTLGELILDLSAVKKIDYSGVGGIITALLSARAKGIPVILYRPSQAIQEMMEQMEVNNLFPLILSEEELIIHSLVS